MNDQMIDDVQVSRILHSEMTKQNAIMKIRQRTHQGLSYKVKLVVIELRSHSSIRHALTRLKMVLLLLHGEMRLIWAIGMPINTRFPCP